MTGIEESKQTNWRLNTKLLDRFNRFYGIYKSRLGFQNPKDAAELLLEGGLDVYEKEMEKRIKEKK
jgi:hypothetical protein